LSGRPTSQAYPLSAPPPYRALDGARSIWLLGASWPVLHQRTRGAGACGMGLIASWSLWPSYRSCYSWPNICLFEPRWRLSRPRIRMRKESMDELEDRNVGVCFRRCGLVGACHCLARRGIHRSFPFHLRPARGTRANAPMQPTAGSAFDGRTLTWARPGLTCTCSTRTI
jgi:hypothetical protein